MSPLSYSPAQHREWESWRSFCVEFEEATGVNMDHERCNKMVDSVKRWGEELVCLRREHPIHPDVLNSMREDAPINPKIHEGTRT